MKLRITAFGDRQVTPDEPFVALVRFLAVRMLKAIVRNVPMHAGRS